MDAMRGERCGLDWGTKARLMPVCINAVWHLSARDTHTHHDMLRYCDIVCERVCVEITAPVAKLTAYKLIERMQRIGANIDKEKLYKTS